MIRRAALALLFSSSAGCTVVDLWDDPVITVEPRFCRSDADCDGLAFELAPGYDPKDPCVHLEAICESGRDRCTMILEARDADADGLRDPACSAVHPELEPRLLDCIDTDRDAQPGADLDRDGFQRAGCVLNGGLGDCNDRRPTVFPGATVEACDGFVSNCSAPGGGDAAPAEDRDGDLHTSVGTTVCEVVTVGSTTISYPKDDCDDAVATVFAGAPDRCDGLVNDCSGGTRDATEDADGDGVSPVTATTCEQSLLPPGALPDCDDGNADTYAGAPEVCDGLINDCAARGTGMSARFVEDPDRDGYFASTAPCAEAIRNIECTAAATDPSAFFCPPRAETQVFFQQGASVRAWAVGKLLVDTSSDLVYSVGRALFARSEAATGGTFPVNNPVDRDIVGAERFEFTTTGRRGLFVIRDDIAFPPSPFLFEAYEPDPAVPGTFRAPVSLVYSLAPPTSGAGAYAEFGGSSRFPALAYQTNNGGPTGLVFYSSSTGILTTVDGAAPAFAALRAGEIDGVPGIDLVAVPLNGNVVRVYTWNDTVNNFNPAVMVQANAALTNVRDVRVGDFDGNGLGDLALLADTGSALMSQTTAGTFVSHSLGVAYNGAVPTALPYTELVLRSIYAADIDLDGVGELVYSRFEDDEVGYLEELPPAGSGLFAQHPIVTDLDGAATAVAGDIDGDRDLDVLASGLLASSVSWFESTFVSNFAFVPFNVDRAFTDVDQVRIADVDGDGRNDVLASANGPNVTLWRSLADDGSTFAESRLGFSAAAVASFTVADFDGDAALDVAVAAPATNRVYFLRGNGEGAFAAAAEAAQVVNPDMTESADLDADGRREILVTSRSTGGPALVALESDGTRFQATTIDASALACPGIAVTDLEGDGREDIALACGTGGLVFLSQQPDGTFVRTVVESTSGRSYRTVAFADLDRDGVAELIAGKENGGHEIHVFVRSGAGFTEDPPVLTGLPPAAVPYFAPGDLDRDGDVDLAVGGNTALMLLQNVHAPSRTLLSLPIGTNRNIPASVAVGDLDRDGIPDVLAAMQQDFDIVWWSTQLEAWWDH